VPAAGPGGGMYAGFTASTGRAWAKHDILSWYWCHINNCQQDVTGEFELVSPLAMGHAYTMLRCSQLDAKVGDAASTSAVACVTIPGIARSLILVRFFLHLMPVAVNTIIITDITTV
jgi:hypothetical protein